MKLPQDVKVILNRLEKAGFEGYVVGGCVRDSLLNKKPKDWDICTNALPNETMSIFSDLNIIPTGLQHGTITVMLNNEGYEITTYRIDGEYTDGRHPNGVNFTSNLFEDLSRRDFTINSMAYNESEGLVDIYGGIDDLKLGIIKCVGNAEERFNEDALRILRALRFASVLNFKIETKTKIAILKLYPNLEKIAKERINVEFSKMLLGIGNVSILNNYKDVIAFIIPEAKCLFGFNQNNPYHIYDVWNHTLKVVENVKTKDLNILLAAFFHDFGKPATYSEDSLGVGHFYKHTLESATICENVLRRLKYSNDVIDEVSSLVEIHDNELVPTNKTIRRLLNKHSKELIYKLIDLKQADILGQNIEYNERLNSLIKFNQLLDAFEERDDCFNLKQLKLNGGDLIQLGIKPGKEMGIILNSLLEKVMNEELENNRESLLDYVLEEFYESIKR